MKRPLHLRLDLVLLVFIGGALGTSARYGLALVIPEPSGWPWPTLIVNAVGAFVLGAFLELLLRTGPDEGMRQRIRIFGATGVLGGFTTYSSLTVETVLLANGAHYVEAGIYAVVSLIIGLLAAITGIWAAATVTRSRIRLLAPRAPETAAAHSGVIEPDALSPVDDDTAPETGAGR